MTRAQIRRCKDNFRALLRRQCAEPATERYGLALAQLGERDIDIADADVDYRLSCFKGSIARDVARGFAVANQVEQIRPDLIWLHAQKQVKERTTSEGLN